MPSTPSSNFLEDQHHILLIEDDEIDRKLIKRALHNVGDTQFIFSSVSTISDAIQHLDHNLYDVVITDLNLPDSSNMDTVNSLLSHHNKVPIVILSGINDEALALSAIHAGVEDFIPKQYIEDKNLIIRTIRHAMERHNLKAGLELTRERERYLAHYDQVTALPNRLLFLDRIFQAVVQAKRSQEPFALCFLDLDRFKTINDTLGHGVGDAVLKVIGGRLLQCVRNSDTVARLGGDEFTIILRNAFDKENVKKITQNIIDEINKPIMTGRHKCNVGASVGIACFPEHGETTEQLLKNADMAMYEAKHKGRNQFHFFSDDLSETSNKNYELETALRDAIYRSPCQFALHYQPKVDLVTQRTTSVEALLRWDSPTLGRIPPDQFIPLAEDTGLIAQVDEWVLRQACKQRYLWKKSGLKPITIAINVSGRSFNDETFLNNVVIPLLEKYQINGKGIEIEITEGVLLTDLEQTQRRLMQLKGLGFSIAIDDFGTGFSSLSYLSKLPIDTLKVDGAFICDASSPKKEQAVLKAIIDLGKALEVRVVAECVETSHQLELLKKLHCDEGQGWLWGKPSIDWQPEKTSAFIHKS